MKIDWIPKEAKLIEELEQYASSGSATALTIVMVVSEDHVPTEVGRYLIKIDAENAPAPPEGNWNCRAWENHRLGSAQIRRLHNAQFECRQLKWPGDLVWSVAEVAKNSTPRELDASDESLSDASLEELPVLQATGEGLNMEQAAQQFAQIQLVVTEDGRLQIANVGAAGLEVDGNGQVDLIQLQRLEFAAQQQMDRQLDQHL